ncbi:DMT family transporter [Deinococcus sp.]|uniref:DMT family transporter n=1 Tax=Deinococcus sp. TaxID=47478 RepID=UPI003CC53AEB
MSWLYVIAAGIAEIVFAISLKASNGFTRLIPSLIFLVFVVASLYCLSQAVKGLPIGTAYAVWTGIGTAGTAIIGLLVLKEPTDAARLISLLLILLGSIGLRLAESR